MRGLENFSLDPKAGAGSLKCTFTKVLHLLDGEKRQLNKIAQLNTDHQHRR